MASLMFSSAPLLGKKKEFPEMTPGIIIRLNLFAQAEALDKLFIAFDIRPVEVRKKPAALADQFEQGTLGMEIMAISSHVASKLFDTLSEHSYLHLGRACVGFVLTVLLNNTIFNLGIKQVIFSYFVLFLNNILYHRV
jgi:acyl dehydratase